MWTRWKQAELLRLSGQGAHEGFASVNSYRVRDRARPGDGHGCWHPTLESLPGERGWEKKQPVRGIVPAGNGVGRPAKKKRGVSERAVPESVPRKDETRIKVSGGL